MSVNLFVYGTLKQGGPSSALLDRFKRFPGTVRGRLYRMPGGYPGLEPDPAGVGVVGEYVEAVDAGTISVLDLYEGVAEGLFVRVPCEVVIGLRRHEAETYVLHGAKAQGGSLIESGIWRNRIRRGRR